MRFHKFRLSILRNRFFIIFTLGAFVFLTFMLIMIMTLFAVQKQSERNEEILKSLSCILLILPEDRNEQKVVACVNGNSYIPDFNFKHGDEQSVKPIEEDTKQYVLPVKGDKGELGEQGKDGEPGKDGVDGNNGIDGQNGTDGENGRTPEFMQLPDGTLLYRYIGDTEWEIISMIEL